MNPLRYMVARKVGVVWLPASEWGSIPREFREAILRHGYGESEAMTLIAADSQHFVEPPAYLLLPMSDFSPDKLNLSG